jgi:hypothetical protein
MLACGCLLLTIRCCSCSSPIQARAKTETVDLEEFTELPTNVNAENDQTEVGVDLMEGIFVKICMLWHTVANSSSKYSSTT